MTSYILFQYKLLIRTSAHMLSAQRGDFFVQQGCLIEQGRIEVVGTVSLLSPDILNVVELASSACI